MKWFIKNWQLIAADFAGTIAFWAATNVAAQVLPESAKSGQVVILKVATMKKGDTCIGVTKRAGHPLSGAQCDALLKSVGRNGKVDSRNPMMQIVIPPLFQVGDHLLFVHSGGQKGWVMTLTSE